MKKYIFYTFALFALMACLTACNDNNNPTPSTPDVVGTWKPGSVLLNNAGGNLASAGQPYANFQLVIEATNEDNGTYSVTGMPLPFPASFSGNWSKAGNNYTLTGAPNGITSLNNLNVANNVATFVMVQNHPKVSVTLNFTLNKQ